MEQAIAALEVPSPPPPRWSDYAADFVAGVPLLQSATVDLEPTEQAIAESSGRVASRIDRHAATPGSGRYVEWLIQAAALRPLIAAFDGWRDDDRWMRAYCPICGSAPAMAQLLGKDPGRRRLLACGFCRTRWRYGRTACPFCEISSHRLSSLAIDGEAGLRIDYCEACSGYLKTYDGEGGEDVLLADWTSLHLDVLAHERGLKRLAASLYELEPQTA